MAVSEESVSTATCLVFGLASTLAVWSTDFTALVMLLAQEPQAMLGTLSWSFISLVTVEFALAEFARAGGASGLPNPLLLSA